MANYDHKNPAFLELALCYERLIDAGAYKEGDRLPSVREVAVSERLNPNTVARLFRKSPRMAIAPRLKSAVISLAKRRRKIFWSISLYPY